MPIELGDIVLSQSALGLASLVAHGGGQRLGQVNPAPPLTTTNTMCVIIWQLE